MQTTSQGVRNLNSLGPKRVRKDTKPVDETRALSCLLGHDLDDSCQCKKCGAWVLNEDEDDDIKEIW